jgi:hypothetical protein
MPDGNGYGQLCGFLRLVDCHEAVIPLHPRKDAGCAGRARESGELLVDQKVRSRRARIRQEMSVSSLAANE